MNLLYDEKLDGPPCPPVEQNRAVEEATPDACRIMTPGCNEREDLQSHSNAMGPGLPTAFCRYWW